MSFKKKCLLLNGGGDCPGLNAVIRSIVRCAHFNNEWEIVGSKRAFNGILEEPTDLVTLTKSMVSGIHIKGGTILETINKGNPYNFPMQDKNGNWISVDRSEELIQKVYDHDFEAVINIGGDGSQRISERLYKKGLNIIGIPKTIDNDLLATDYTFGFQTAVEIATEAVDRLVTTAQSHNRVMIAEVMGRNAGWIALHTGIASGADVILIPEIPFDTKVIIKKLQERIKNNRGFAVIVVAEGAYPKNGRTISKKSNEIGYQAPLLGGIGNYLLQDLQKSIDIDSRVTVLGHIQRGGRPIAFDRILASALGVKAFELIQNQKYGHMVAYQHQRVTSVPLQKAIEKPKYIGLDNDLINTAHKLGICLGD